MRSLQLAVIFVVGTLGLVAGLAFIPDEYWGLFVGSAAVLALSLWLMHLALGRFDIYRITFPTFWFIGYLASIWIPSFIIFFGITPEHYGWQIRLPELYTYTIAVQSVLITAPTGILLANWMLGFRESGIRQYFDTPVQEEAVSPLAFAVFFGCAVVMVLFYLSDLRTIPVIELLRDPGDYQYLADIREESFSGLSSPLLYFYSVLREAIFPFLVAVALGSYLHRRRVVWAFLLASSFTVAILFASISTARGPVATIFLVLCVFYYVFRSGKISRRWIVGAPILVLAFPFAVNILKSSNTGLWDSLQNLVIRLFYGPAYVAYVYFEVVPMEVGFQHGATIGKLSWLLGMRHFNMGLYVLLHIYPDAPLSGGAGGAFFADFYANWGMPGVLLSGLLLGFVLQAVQIFIMRRRKTVASLAAYAFLYYAFWMTTSRPLPTVLLSTGVLFVIPLWGAISLASGVLSSRRPWVLGGQTQVKEPYADMASQPDRSLYQKID
jgi:oligosaccharide repeat unit polymerase